MDWDSITKPKYNLWVISGKFGGGKTLFMSAFACEQWKKFDVVYATYKLNPDFVPNFEWIKPKNFRAVKLKNLEPNSLLLATEASNFIDRREAMKKKNVKITQALMEIRKTKVHQIYDIFDIMYLDFRLVEFVTYCLKALGEIDNQILKQILEKQDINITDKMMKDKELEGYFAYQKQLYNEKKGRFKVTGEPIIKNMKPYYDSYDTYEITNRDRLLEEWSKEESKKERDKRVMNKNIN